MTTTPTPHVSGTIKALEWTEWDTDCWFSSLDGFTIAPSSSVNHDGEYRLACDRASFRYFPTVDAAKAAAQADYEARILAAIQPDPQPVASEAVACSADHLDMAAPECPVCGAFQEATPSSAPASVAEAEAVIRTQGVEWTASAMILHIADVLRPNGKAVLTSDTGDFGRQVLDFAAALRALSEESK